METKISGEVLYQGKVLKLERDTVLLDNGKTSFREIVRHHGGAGILCINEKNQVLLIRQFRYAYKETLYEIPAGKLEDLENPLETAQREFVEETGYQALDMAYLTTIYPTCGYSDEKIYLYLVRKFLKTEPHFDEDEVIEAEFINLEEVLKMIQEGIIKDAKTICAINAYLLMQNTLKF